MVAVGAPLSRLAPLLERSVPPFPRPRRALEQYRTPPELALRMAQLLASRGCLVAADLGSGTGMIAYAASSMGMYVAAIDIDGDALEVARGSPLYASLLVDLIQADARRPPLRRVDCVAMNPPFGVVRRGADVEFLRAAASLEPSHIASLHLASSGAGFIAGVLGALGYELLGVEEYPFPIPQVHRRHRKRIHYTRVLLVLARRRG